MAFLIIWVISPVVLIPLVIYFIIDKRNKKKEIESAQSQIYYLKEEISHLKQRIDSLKKYYGNAQPQNIPESATVMADEHSPGVQNDIEDVVPKVEIDNSPVVTINEPVIQDKSRGFIKKGLPSGTALFGIGILFVLVAGAIFATTTWQVLSSFGKVATLLGAVAVFYVSSYIAKKKLQLRETSITFFLLGSSFLSVINLGVGYFRWFGDYYALVGDQSYLVLSVSIIILSVALYIGKRLYDLNLLGIMSYVLLLAGIILFVRFVTDVFAAMVLVSGIYIAVTWTYILVKNSDSIGTGFGICIDLLSYAYLFMSLTALSKSTHIIPAMLIILLGLVIAIEMSGLLVQKFNNKNVLHIYGAVFSFIVPLKIFIDYKFNYSLPAFVIFAMIYTLIFKFVKSGEDEPLGNYVSDVLSGVLLFIAATFSFVGIETKIYMLAIMALWLVVLGVFVSFIFVFNKSSNKVSRMMDFINADISIYAMCIFASGLNAVENELIWLFILTIISIAVFACFELQEQNYAGFFPVCMFDGAGLYIISQLFDDKESIQILLSVILFAITIFVGRLRYKNIFRVEENKQRLDWLGLISLLYVVYIYYFDNKYVPFICCILVGIYFANFYKRVHKLIGNAFLSISVVFAGLALYNWPFFEIKSSFEAEWNIMAAVFVMICCGFIWKNVEDLYSKIISVIAAFIYYIYISNKCSEIMYLSAGKTMYIAVLKILFYFAGAAILFGFSVWRNNRAYLIASGFLLACSSLFADYLVTKWLIVIPIILGIGFSAYIIIFNRKNMLFFPIAQLYSLLVILDVPVYVFIPLFLGSIIYGYMKYEMIVKTYDYGIDIDWFTILSVWPMLIVIDAGNEKWLFCGAMMLAIIILSLYKRLTRRETVNRGILTVASTIIGLAMINQPFFNVSRDWRTEFYLVFVWLVVIFNVAFVYKNMLDEKKYQTLYLFAIGSIVWQSIDAISANNVVDALILGIAMTILLIFSFMFKKKMWFLLAGITLILQGIYTSRRFWLSIAWWVYLLAVGVILISIAAINEYRKRNDEEREQMNLFTDWNNW